MGPSDSSKAAALSGHLGDLPEAADN